MIAFAVKYLKVYKEGDFQSRNPVDSCLYELSWVIVSYSESLSVVEYNEVHLVFKTKILSGG